MENRVTSVTGGASFVYDGDGNRVKKTENNETILYVNQFYEKNITTGVITTYYYLGGKLVANRVDTTVNYLHLDHLGSTSVVSDTSGTQTETIRYFPFGGVCSGSVSTDKKFTGQRLDATGLYYYGARYYDCTIGRFISADPLVQSAPLPFGKIIGSITVSYSGRILPDGINPRNEYDQNPQGQVNPQELNRYTYALNNPLRYIDPDGNQTVVGEILIVGVIGGIIWLGCTIAYYQSGYGPGESAKKAINDIAEDIGQIWDNITNWWDSLFKFESYIPITVWPTNPYDFNPPGLDRVEYDTPNGKIIKWIDPETGEEKYQYHEDIGHGAHYHDETTGEDHIPPGTGE